jgi:hypothetical protein
MKILSFDVGLKNLAYCVYETSEDKILTWSVDEIKGCEITRAMVKHLDSLNLECDTILIEKQPTRNNKMRIIENLIHVYYVIKSPEKKIVVYSPKHKLGKETFKGAKMYRERKKLGINRCNSYLLQNKAEWIDFFSKSKKKDDLADSLLQALSYCNRLPTGEVENICKVVARKPTPKQEKNGYSKSNLKYLIINNEINMNANSKFYKSFSKYFKNMEEAYVDLQITSI